MDNLSLEIAEAHRVSVEYADCPDSGSGEIEADGASESSRTDYEYTACGETLLPGKVNFAELEVTPVACGLFFCQGCRAVHSSDGLGVEGVWKL